MRKTLPTGVSPRWVIMYNFQFLKKKWMSPQIALASSRAKHLKRHRRLTDLEKLIHHIYGKSKVFRTLRTARKFFHLFLIAPVLSALQIAHWTKQYWAKKYVLKIKNFAFWIGLTNLSIARVRSETTKISPAAIEKTRSLKVALSTNAASEIAPNSIKTYCKLGNFKMSRIFKKNY